jgi:signal transduction histidine kinase
MTINEDRLRIYVTDTGPGLTRQQISQLFTPFERLNAPNHIEGTGIGLSISQNYMELMHGTIGVDSIPGEGSTFYIELELHPTE